MREKALPRSYHACLRHSFSTELSETVLGGHTSWQSMAELHGDIFSDWSGQRSLIGLVSHATHRAPVGDEGVSATYTHPVHGEFTATIICFSKDEGAAMTLKGLFEFESDNPPLR